MEDYNRNDPFPGKEAAVTDLWDWYYIEFMNTGWDRETSYLMAGEAVNKYLNGGK